MTLRQHHYIDLHKGATLWAILSMMALYHCWDNVVAWVYLAEHGTYGVLWCLKSRVFGDKRFAAPASPAYGLLIWVALSLYWVAPWIIISREVNVPAWYLGTSVAMFSVGVFFHFVADMQKYMHMQLRPGQLLQDGLWRRCRNPNYLGELLIYLGFGMLAQHWAPVAALAVIIACEWLPSMLRKDKSLSRYPEFAAWKARSGLMFPQLAP